MKRLPMNPREDADVIRTGEFPDASEPARPYVRPVCENCIFWQREKWDDDYVEKWGESNEGQCMHGSRRACFSGIDKNGVEHFSRTITGCYATCTHWEL